ncbi:L-TYPE LECTIN-DOMAIN CONTAINING RECEPTOR KINASE IV.1-LIKE [Salix viminalis]|uniref:non-specific serine/threonine protein kinase n=1 Tax=Salix viminalis TaxID=40686 RepID=A0A9Q0V4X7_SALVM|nr:L-TYPE LECTIN-DOMAIN CONTAINING RECEPTOR KINASE IV.1-LIKE [Salix viminalis]
MLFKIVLLVHILSSLAIAASQDLNFIYSGFRSTNLSLHGSAQLTSNGLLRLTKEFGFETSHAFYPNPVTFKNSIDGSAFSFSSTFVFAIRPQYADLGGHGMAFVIAPTRGLPGYLSIQYLGLFNESNNGNQTNHVVAVELDTVYNSEFNDLDNNHVGIDINGLESVRYASAGYYSQLNGKLTNLTLISGQPMQVWIEYGGMEKQINVTIAPIGVDKPSRPLLSLSRDLSPYLNSSMYIGFSSSTGSIYSSHYVLGWSFKMNGQAEALDISRLPRVGPKKTSKFLTIGLPVLCLSLVFVAVSSVSYGIRRRRKFAEVLEDWELGFGPQRFKYKDLYTATKGFGDKELLGSGGFGRVYKGATTSTDVFAFGAFLLEVASGRRPIQPAEDVILVDWVFARWLGGEILEARDPNLGTEYVAEEMELVLQLGLMCSQSEPAGRPSMRQVVQFLEGDTPLPDISLLRLPASNLPFSRFDDFAMSSMGKSFSHTSVAESLLSGGR